MNCPSLAATGVSSNLALLALALSGAGVLVLALRRLPTRHVGSALAVIVVVVGSMIAPSASAGTTGCAPSGAAVGGEQLQRSVVGSSVRSAETVTSSTAAPAPTLASSPDPATSIETSTTSSTTTTAAEMTTTSTEPETTTTSEPTGCCDPEYCCGSGGDN